MPQTDTPPKHVTEWCSQDEGYGSHQVMIWFLEWLVNVDIVWKANLYC